MSVSLLPGIEELDPDSLCYSIYTQLYLNFYNAQDTGTVTEGDTTSIRLHNTAYGFAEAIAGSVSGEGSSGGGVLGSYLKLSGGNMSGPLRADYGFTAGVGNVRVIEIFEEESIRGMRVTGRLYVDGDGFYLGDRCILNYHPDTGWTDLDSDVLSLGDTALRTAGEILLGNDAATGIHLTPNSATIAGHSVYHSGNANNTAIDWVMKDATVAGGLTVAGEVALNGSLTALHGASLGDGGKTFLLVRGTMIGVGADLDIHDAKSIRFGNKPVLSLSGADRLWVATPGGDLLLGAEPTPRVRLMTTLTDQQGTRALITPAGGAYFPESLRVAHNFSGDLLSSFNEEDGGQGIDIHKELRFGDINAISMQGDNGMLLLTSLSVHVSANGVNRIPVAAWVGHTPSVSLVAPQNRDTDTFVIHTEGDFIQLDNKTEVIGSIGIAGSLTRLEQECLFFTDKHRLQSVEGGVKHYGLAQFTDGITSELFSSGLAGSGWAILRNGTTGNAVATFDEVVVRHKIRVYEMEVQRATATNGSLWISDSCSGDSVEKL